MMKIDELLDLFREYQVGIIGIMFTMALLAFMVWLLRDDKTFTDHKE